MMYDLCFNMSVQVTLYSKGGCEPGNEAAYMVASDSIRSCYCRMMSTHTHAGPHKGSVWDVATQQPPQEENETTSPLSR